MSKTKKNFSWMLAGNTIYAFNQWIQISIISKLCKTETLGLYTYALAITAPIFMLTNLQLRNAQARDSTEEYQFSTYMTLRLLGILSTTVAISLYLLLKQEENTCRILALVTLIKSVEGISEIFNARLQSQERIKNISYSLIIRGTGTSLSILTGLFLWKNLSIALSLALLANIAIVLFYDKAQHKTYSPKIKLINFEKQVILKLIKRTFPLGLTMMTISLNSNVPKYVIEYISGTEKQAIYSTLNYIIVAGGFVISAMGQTLLPKMAKLYDNKEWATLKKLIKKSILMTSIFGIVSLTISFLFGEQLLSILFSKTISENTDLLNWIVFSGIFIYISSTLGFAMTSIGIFRIQPKINLATLLMNCFFSIVFVYKFGVFGAILSLILSQILQITLSIRYIYQTLNSEKE